MTDLETIRAALEESFDAIEALGADLATAEWETQSLCPDWTVRGVFDHVVSIENALVSWAPDGADTPPPFTRRVASPRRPSNWTPAPSWSACTPCSPVDARTSPSSAQPTLRSHRGHPWARLRTAASWRYGSSTSGCTSETSVPRFVAQRMTPARGRRSHWPKSRDLSATSSARRWDFPTVAASCSTLTVPLPVTLPSSWTEEQEWSKASAVPTWRSGRTRSPSSNWPAAARPPGLH